MPDISPPELLPASPGATLGAPTKLEAIKIDPHETQPPRTVVFGEVTVTEDLHRDLLTSSEKDIYRTGFDTLKTLVETGTEMEKMILLHPHIASALIGIQPWAQLDVGEAALLQQAFQKTEPNLSARYGLFEHSTQNDSKLSFINLNAAKNILEQYQAELPDIPNVPLSKEATIGCIRKLLNHPVGSVRVLTRGLLSGFPLEDCKNRSFGDYADPAITLQEISDWNKYFTSKTTIRAFGKQISFNPASMVNARLYGRNFYGNQYLPDHSYVDNKSGDVMSSLPRDALHDKRDDLTVHGFGLLWKTSNPPREVVITQCQKVLQVDRELGILEFITEERRSINYDKNIREIKFGDLISSIGIRGIYHAREDLQFLARKFRGVSSTSNR